MNVIYFYLFFLAHPYLSLWWIGFEKAGRQKWEALVPGYNYFVAFKIGCNKPWWSLLMIFPGVHLVMWSALNVSYLRRFGHFSWQDTLQGIFFPYILSANISKKEIQPTTNWANPKEVHRRSVGDHIILILCLPGLGHIISYLLGFFSREKTGKKSRVKEWGDSILFALVAASIIRTYVFEPFQIPTGSMEKTLLVGDFLFVNKLSYGSKIPITPLSFPLVHNTIPWVDIKSYSTLETMDYTRLPGFGQVQRNDVVVFNYPSGDTAVYDPRMPFGLMGHDYYGVVINEAKRLWKESTYSQSERQALAQFYYDSLTKVNNVNLYPKNVMDYMPFVLAEKKMDQKYGQNFLDNINLWQRKARNLLAVEKKAMDNRLGEMIDHYGLIYRPVDKRENYIKRCVGLPGDVLEIKNSVLYINGKKSTVFPGQCLKYHVSNLKERFNSYTNLSVMLQSEPYLLEVDELGHSRMDFEIDVTDGIFKMVLTKKELRDLKKIHPDVKFVVETSKPVKDKNGNYSVLDQMENLSYFPKDIHHGNNATNFEKITIPKKGAVVKLTKENIPLYRRIITAYEGHKLKETSNGFYIDGKKVSTYKFKMNYYWMMGDNRYNSADSRVWGFVPEDHIVGKASLVWFSKRPYQNFEGKTIRYDRIFKFIK